MSKKIKQNQQILEVSHAIALTIKNIAPKVIAAYPITPQTHIVEDLAKMKAEGEGGYEYLRAESEFAAASIVLGASATGVRVYSATSSQGLLLMTEVIYNIAGLRLPVVMTCANRSISAPINIWNDHSDVMSIRDAGFIQLFAANAQEAVNQHILAYKLAEKLSLAVMVNLDGFILTHSYEPVIIPDKKTIKKFLPDFKPAVGTYLDSKDPVTLGAFFPPSFYMPARQDLHQDLLKSLNVVKKEYALLIKTLGFNNRDNGLVEYSGPKNPKIILVALGSMNGTILEAIRNNKEYLATIGLLKIKVYRPFPRTEVVKFLEKCSNIAVLEKALSLGQAGPLYNDIAEALNSGQTKKQNIKNYIVGLGGRDVTKKIITAIIADAPKKNDYLKFYE
jgi:pyruvate ferredoxin oxidoreductase alpha subunit